MDFKSTQVGVDFKSIKITSKLVQNESDGFKIHTNPNTIYEFTIMDFKSLLKSTNPSESLYSSTIADSDLAKEVKEEFISPMGGTCEVRRAFIMSRDALEQTGMEGQEDEVHEMYYELMMNTELNQVQTERQKNSVLQQENDKLVTENMAMRVENARLKEQLDRAAAIDRSFLGCPLSAAELGVEGGPPAEAESIAPDLTLAADG